MKINVKRIPVDGETLQDSEPASILALDDSNTRFEHPVEYRLHAQIQENAVLVTGKLLTKATMRCSRCVKEFQCLVRVDDFVFHRELAGEDFVDLTDNIREDIILQLPQRALCQKDCQGLCLVCGKDLNEGACQCKPPQGDMHWHVLDQIKLK